MRSVVFFLKKKVIYNLWFNTLGRREVKALKIEPLAQQKQKREA